MNGFLISFTERGRIQKEEEEEEERASERATKVV